jgi:hypothetical protein
MRPKREPQVIVTALVKRKADPTVWITLATIGFLSLYLLV